MIQFDLILSIPQKGSIVTLQLKGEKRGKAKRYRDVFPNLSLESATTVSGSPCHHEYLGHAKQNLKEGVYR